MVIGQQVAGATYDHAAAYARGRLIGVGVGVVEKAFPGGHRIFVASLSLADADADNRLRRVMRGSAKAAQRHFALDQRRCLYQAHHARALRRQPDGLKGQHHKISRQQHGDALGKK